MSDQEMEQQIIENEKLVYFVINRYFHAYHADDDLVQCGRIGLWRACNGFDSSRGKFSTFATKCIYNEIVREIRCRSSEREAGYIESLDRVIGTDEESGGDITVGQMIPVIEDGYCEIDYDISSVEKKLSARDTDVFRMYIDGFRPAYIARAYGFTRSWASGVIKNAQYIARRELLGHNGARKPA